MYPKQFHQPAKSALLLVLMVCLCLSSTNAFAGVGGTILTVFEPRIEAADTTATGHTIATSLQKEIRQLMDQHEVWGVELTRVETATSASENTLGTRSPQWSGQFTGEWKALVNTGRSITYAAFGSAVKDAAGKWTISYDLWDLILNHKIASFSGTGDDPATAAKQAAPSVLSALQLYLAEVTEVGKGRAMINVGYEALSTGTMLGAYAHGHIGVHRPGYAAHGHREEDDHLLGSKVYREYLGAIPTTASIHSHSRSRWRSLLRGYAPAFEDMQHLGGTSLMAVPASAPAAPQLAAPGLPSAAVSGAPGTPGVTNPFDVMTTPTAEEKQLLDKAHAGSGKQTGVLRVTGFIKPHRYFNAYYALAEVVEGDVFPGSFVRLRTDNRETTVSAHK